MKPGAIEGPVLDRRRFLYLCAAASFPGCALKTTKPEYWSELSKREFLEFELFRPEDGFSATVEVYGFALKTFFGNTCLVSKSNADDNSRMLVFHFPPQHNAETALERFAVCDALGTAAIDDLLATVGYLSAKRSKLVFRVPLNDQALPVRGRAMTLNLSSLLSWEHE